jgi:hypothetical protein
MYIFVFYETRWQCTPFSYIISFDKCTCCDEAKLEWWLWCFFVTLLHFFGDIEICGGATHHSCAALTSRISTNRLILLSFKVSLCKLNDDYGAHHFGKWNILNLMRFYVSLHVAVGSSHFHNSCVKQVRCCSTTPKLHISHSKVINKHNVSNVKPKQHFEKDQSTQSTEWLCMGIFKMTKKQYIRSKCHNHWNLHTVSSFLTDFLINK